MESAGKPSTPAGRDCKMRGGFSFFAALVLLGSIPAVPALAQSPHAGGAGHRATSGKYQGTASLKARLWILPADASERETAKPTGIRCVLVGRDAASVYRASEEGTDVPVKTSLGDIVGLDFDVNYDRFAVAKAMARGDWGTAIPILRKAYSPFFPYLDVAGNNVLEGAYDLGVTMFKSARATMRKAKTDDEREQARRQFAAAQEVFSACAKAGWSSYGTLAQLRLCHCMIKIDAEKALRAARLVAAIAEPQPGDETYGYYWLLKAELARLAGDTEAELDAAIKSLVHENKDIETFPDALLLSAQCYETIGDPHRARNVYYEVAKLFPGTDWAADALTRLRLVVGSGLTGGGEDTTTENAFFGLEEDMDALVRKLLEESKTRKDVFDYDEEESEVAEMAN